MSQLTPYLFMAYTTIKRVVANRQHEKALEEKRRKELIEKCDFEDSEIFDGVRPYKRKYKSGEITNEEYNKIYNEALQRWRNKIKNDKSDNNGE